MAKTNIVRSFPVTFVPTSLRNPSVSGTYLCMLGGYMTTLSYSKKHDLWNYRDEYNPAVDKMYFDKDTVVAWALVRPIIDTFKEASNDD